MTATSKTANDKTGAPLYIGDEIICRATVTDVTNGHVLTNSVEPPNREMWFHGSLIERTVQGLASTEADKKVGQAAAAPAAPAALESVIEVKTGPVPQGGIPAIIPDTPREQAIAFVQSKGYKERAAAERVVDEHGWRTILDDRDEETEAAKKALGTAGTNAGAAASAPASTASSADPSAKPGNAAAENQAATPGADKAPTN